MELEEIKTEAEQLRKEAEEAGYITHMWMKREPFVLYGALWCLHEATADFVLFHWFYVESSATLSAGVWNNRLPTMMKFLPFGEVEVTFFMRLFPSDEARDVMKQAKIAFRNALRCEVKGWEIGSRIFSLNEFAKEFLGFISDRPANCYAPAFCKVLFTLFVEGCWQ